MKIRILFVIENSFFGGGERAFSQIINGLNKEKFEIYVACLSRKDLHLRDESRSTASASEFFVEKIKDVAEIIPLDLSRRFNFTNIYYLAKVMKEKRIDIVHSQGARTDFFVRFAARRARIAGRLAKVPVIISTIAMPVEGFDVGFFKKGIYITLDRFSEKFVDRFIVVSEALRKRLVEKHKIPSEKVCLIYNGVEIEEYNDKWASGERIREQFKIEKGVPLIGTIGRLVWQKGLPYFIQAAKVVTESLNRLIAPSPKFLIVGEGEERKNLESLICNLQLDDKVILTGFRKDVKEFLSALDILVLSSLREGFPMITLEAMAMGKPVIASNIEGIREQVINGETGILVPPREPQALAEATLRLTQDENLRKKMGSAGRKLVEERFNIKESIKQHEELYFMFVSGKWLIGE